MEPHVVKDNPTPKGYEPKSKMSGMAKLFALITLAFVGYGVFLGYSVARVQGDTALIQEETKAVEVQLAKLEKNKVKDIVVAKQAMEKIEAIDVRWSEVLSLLLDATPDDIVYRSYSGNENGSITMSVMAPSFNRVADLIDILGNKSFIDSAFVPSIVKGTSPTNAATYSFSLNVMYKQ